MFKVPEWGNDVPDSVNFAKSTQLQKKARKPSTPVTKVLPMKTQVNGNVQNLHHAKKSTDKRKLKKIRQKNREIYQKLSKPQQKKPESSFNNQPGRFVLNPNKAKTEEKMPQHTPKNSINNNKHENRNKPKPNKSQKQKNQNQRAFNAPNDNRTDTKKPKKRKHNKDSLISNIELDNIDTDKADELIINAKKKKLNDAFKDEDQEEILFGGTPVEKPQVKFDRKKEQIRKLLETKGNRNSINVSGNSNLLRERMLAKLQAAQFRYLNEKLYTSSGTEAKQLFQSDPAAFDTYHQGYQQQIKKWPVNPLDVIVKRIMKMPKTHVIADMGCGSATLARRVPHAVRSFDLVASAPGVEACDMARTPLPARSVDVVVYCLALMGTQLAECLAEGNRVLKTGGHLLIAEVESRFDKLEEFTRGVERLGFKLAKADQSQQVFYFLEFKKLQEASKKARHVPLTLKPCLYKRR